MIILEAGKGKVLRRLSTVSCRRKVGRVEKGRLSWREDSEPMLTQARTGYKVGGLNCQLGATLYTTIYSVLLSVLNTLI